VKALEKNYMWRLCSLPYQSKGSEGPGTFNNWRMEKMDEAGLVIDVCLSSLVVAVEDDFATLGGDLQRASHHPYRPSPSRLRQGANQSQPQPLSSYSD